MYCTMVERESSVAFCSICNVVMRSAKGVPKMELSKIASCAFEALSVYRWEVGQPGTIFSHVRESTDRDQIA